MRTLIPNSELFSDKTILLPLPEISDEGCSDCRLLASIQHPAEPQMFSSTLTRWLFGLNIDGSSKL